MSSIPPIVTVVDYGTGNILSVTRALEDVGALAVVTDSAAVIDKAERVLLPGVGAFGKAMDELHARGLVQPLSRVANSNRPFLGICLGMQLMMEQSNEFGHHEGLGLILGNVEEIPRTGSDGRPHKIPHIGWNHLTPSAPECWHNSCLRNFTPGTPMYFVHSYAVAPSNEADRLADTDYDGCRITAALKHGNMTGIQCHPEKSGPAGLAVLSAFISEHPA